MRLLIYKVFLALCTLEGVLSLVLLLMVPSEAKSVIFLSYSTRKIVIVGFVLVVDVIFAWLTFRAILNEHWLDQRMKAIETVLETRDNLFYFTFVLLLGIILISVLLVITKITGGGTLYFAIIRAWYPIIWFEVIFLQIAFMLGYFYGKTYIQNSWLSKLLIIFTLFAVNLFQWFVLIYKLGVYTGIYNWTWKFPPIKHFSVRDSLTVVMVVGSVFLAWYLLRKPSKMWKSVILIILWGIFLQFGFGMIDGALPGSIQHKYSEIYTQEAAKDPNLVQLISTYEDIYGKSSIFTGTKPPGFMFVYVVAEKIANYIQPHSTAPARLDFLLQFIVVLFPVISFLVIIPLYAIARKIGGEQIAIIACLFYLFFPNVLLMPLCLDQVLNPFLFVVSLLFVMTAIEKRSFWMAVITGSFLYLAVFFSFSILPAVFMGYLMLGLHYLLLRKELGPAENQMQLFIRYFLLATGILIGMVFSFVIFMLAFQYNPIIRYENAIQLHQQIKGLSPFNFSSLNLSFLRYFLVGANADFTFWTGYTPIVLFLIAIGVSFKNLVRKQINLTDWLAISFFVTFVVLNLSGQTSNETGRLWIFLTPLLALFSAEPAAKLFPHRKHGIFLFIILQLITTYLIFHFNDFIL